MNNRLRAIAAYLKCRGSPLKVPKLKEPVRVLPAYTPADILTIAKVKPQTRLTVLLLTLADTGCRIDEALSLRWEDVDFDNLLLTVTGKGNKQRKIPFSFELRERPYLLPRMEGSCANFIRSTSIAPPG